MPKPPTTKAATTRVLYALLFIYAGIAGTYEVVNSVSTTIGNFNLRNQVQAPFQLYGNLIYSPTAAATHAGLAKGDTVLAINRLPFTGMALWQRIRWYARPGETVTACCPQTERDHTHCDDSSRGLSERLVSGGPASPDHAAGSDFCPDGGDRNSAFLPGAGRLGRICPPVRSQRLVHPRSSDLSASVQSRGVSLVDSGLAGPSTLLAPRDSILSAGRFISSGFALSGAIAPR